MLLNRLVNSANFLNFSTVVSSPFNSSKFYCTSNNSGEEIIDEATVYLQNRNSRGQPNNVGNHNIGGNRAFHQPNRYQQQQAQQFRPTGGGYQYQQQYSRTQQNQRSTNIQPQRRQQNWQPLQRMQMKPQPPPAMNQSPVYNQMNIQPQPQKSQSDTLADLMMQQKIDNLQNNIMQMMQMQLQNQMFQQQSQAQIGGVSQVLSQQLVNFMLQSHMNQQQLPALSPPSTPVQSTPVPQQPPDKNQMATSLISQWLNSRVPTQKPQMAKSYDYVGEENIHQQNVQQQPQQYQQYRPPPPLQPRQGGPPQKFTRMVLNQSPREHQMQNTGSSVVKQTQIANRNEYIEEQEDFEELPFRPKKQLEKPKEEEEENVAATSTNSEKEEENGDNKNEEENDKSMGSAFLSGKMEASGSN